MIWMSVKALGEILRRILIGYTTACKISVSGARVVCARSPGFYRSPTHLVFRRSVGPGRLGCLQQAFPVHGIRFVFLLLCHQSPGETQLRLARLHFSRVWHRLFRVQPAPSAAAPAVSEDHPSHTPRSLPPPTCVKPDLSIPSLKGSDCRHQQAAQPRGTDCVAAALQAYRLAEHTLRRHQQVELLSPALFEQGNLLCVAGRLQLAAKAWSEAVDAAHRQMNVISDNHLRPDTCTAEPRGSDSDGGASSQQRPATVAEAYSTQEGNGSKTKCASADDIGHGDQSYAGGSAGPATRLALRSLLPLYFAARLGHFNALDYHLSAAQFAVQIVDRFFRISEPHPSRRSRFFRFRSDGKITRYRMREACPMLSDLHALFEEGEACAGGQNAKVFLGALQWFAQVLTENEINLQAAHCLLTLAEYVAADLCRHVRTVLECRLRRTMLLLRYTSETHVCSALLPQTVNCFCMDSGTLPGL